MSENTISPSHRDIVIEVVEAIWKVQPIYFRNITLNFARSSSLFKTFIAELMEHLPAQTIFVAMTVHEQVEKIITAIGEVKNRFPHNVTVNFNDEGAKIALINAVAARLLVGSSASA